MSTVSLGSDHRGFFLKESLESFLRDKGWEPVDRGCDLASPKVDYPDFAEKVCNDVASGKADMGVLICGSGIGMSIAANKIRGIRAALCRDVFSATMARQHNNANVLVLAGDWTDEALARQIMNAWLGGEFQGGRHQTRLDKVTQLEGGR